MYNFTYHCSASLDQAKALFDGSDDARYMAGGMTLLPTMKLHLVSPSDVIDLACVPDMTGIRCEDDTVVIKAMTTHAVVAASAELADAIPVLAQLAGQIGDLQVRNRGTLGGSIANADPAADYPAAVLGLGATVHTNARSIAGDDFFISMFETALEDGELITGVSFPVPEAACYTKFPNPASRYAMVGVMVAQTGGGVRVAVTGAGPSVFRVGDMERALAENFSTDALDGFVVSEDGLISDIHASADYRSNLISVMAKRAVAGCG